MQNGKSCRDDYNLKDKKYDIRTRTGKRSSGDDSFARQSSDRELDFLAKLSSQVRQQKTKINEQKRMVTAAK